MLVLRFVVDNGKTQQLIMSPAKISNLTGLYNDAIYIYTEAGKFMKKDIRGSVEELFSEEAEI